MEELIRWAVGLLGVALIAGHFLTRWFVQYLNRKIETDEENSPWSKIPSWLRKTLIGFVERTFFTVVIAVDLSGTAIAMIGWTALKGTLYWASFKEKYPGNVLVAIIGSLVSLLFAIIGAQICKGRL